MKARISIDSKKVISKIDNRLYGSFIEHLGRAVYGGIYEPDHASADEHGWRGDVLDVIKDLGLPVVRYPGGNFVSGYCWEDGIGDRSKREKKLDLAWFTIETNEVGLDEFQDWAKRAGTEILYAVNLGTRGADEARAVVEYCNLDTDTKYANLRKKHGFKEPFKIKTWCLGNEMDGPWQMGHKTPMEYARLAHETAKLMKWTDSDIELVACGSSMPEMETYKVWEETVLRECYDVIDYLSLHRYYGNPNNDSAEFLASSLDMDDFIKEVIGICDTVKAEKKSEKTINLSFDEWNVWFHSNEQDKQIPKWTVAPPLLEDIYTLEDSLVVATLLNCLIKHSDRVKIACLAQLVNVIAPIMTEKNGKLWLQTIFYPFMYACKHGRGSALDINIEADSYSTAKRKDIPFVDASCVINDEESELYVFAVNRSLNDSVQIDFEFLNSTDFKLTEHMVLNSSDIKDSNTKDCPDKVVPVEGSLDLDDLCFEAHSYHFMKFIHE